MEAWGTNGCCISHRDHLQPADDTCRRGSDGWRISSPWGTWHTERRDLAEPADLRCLLLRWGVLASAVRGPLSWGMAAPSRRCADHPRRPSSAAVGWFGTGWRWRHAPLRGPVPTSAMVPNWGTCRCHRSGLSAATGIEVTWVSLRSTRYAALPPLATGQPTVYVIIELAFFPALWEPQSFQD